MQFRKHEYLFRRPIDEKIGGIGVWKSIIDNIAKISIISNAFIIGLTSEFIPKTVYKYFYSPDGTLDGYVTFSLSNYTDSSNSRFSIFHLLTDSD